MTNKKKFNEIDLTIKILEDVKKDVFKSKKWKYKGGFIYIKIDDFIYTCLVYETISKDQIKNPYRVEIDLSIKHIQIDNIFWDIMDIQNNKKAAISLRIDGWFTLPSTPISKWFDHIDIINPENSYLVIYDKVIKLVEKTKKNIFDIESYLNYIRSINNHPLQAQFNKDDLLICGYILQNKWDKALDLTEEIIKIENLNSKSYFLKPFYLRAQDFILKSRDDY